MQTAARAGSVAHDSLVHSLQGCRYGIMDGKAARQGAVAHRIEEALELGILGPSFLPRVNNP